MDDRGGDTLEGSFSLSEKGGLAFGGFQEGELPRAYRTRRARLAVCGVPGCGAFYYDE